MPRDRHLDKSQILPSAIKELISIVTPATFMRWLNAEEKKAKSLNARTGSRNGIAAGVHSSADGH